MGSDRRMHRSKAALRLLSPAGDAHRWPHMNKISIASLYKHFVAADVVNEFIFVKAPAKGKMKTVDPELVEAGQSLSSMLRLQIFYALLYVVVEGYRDLKCTDADVDALLANTEHVEAFRRFRNANFHYQEDPFSPKLVDFLHAPGSEDWSRELYGALQAFFMKNLSIQEYLDRLTGTKPR